MGYKFNQFWQGFSYVSHKICKYIACPGPSQYLSQGWSIINNSLENDIQNKLSQNVLHSRKLPQDLKFSSAWFLSYHPRRDDGMGKVLTQSHKCSFKVDIVTTRSIQMWSSWNIYMDKKVYPALRVSVAGHCDMQGLQHSKVPWDFLRSY